MKSPWLRSTTAAWIIGLLSFLVLRPMVHHGLQMGIEWRAERVWEASKPRLAQDLRTLDPVLHALEQYRIDHAPKGAPFLANYPATLQELVPRYLKALPTLPPTLRKLQYERITARQSLMPPPPLMPGVVFSLDSPLSCELTIPLSSRATWGQFLGTEPRGTLVYRGLGWTVTRDRPMKFLGGPDERLAGWGYYSPYRHGFGRRPSAPDPHEEAKLPYRKTRLQALQPLADALGRYWKDHVGLPNHPPTHPETLQALVPHYLPSLPKLPAAFGPLHYEKSEHRGWLWVRLNEQVITPAGKPLDISGTFFYTTEGGSPEIILDQSDPTSRPVRRVGGVGDWAVYD